jgi:hypothetical protein
VADILLAVHDRTPHIAGQARLPFGEPDRTVETAVLMPISVKMLFSALEEIRTPNLLIRSNHAYCDVLNEKWAVQPTGRANRTRNSQMLSVRRPRAPYGATYGARSITAWLIAGSQRSRLSGRSTIMLPSYRGPLTSSHRCLVVGGHQKLPSGGQHELSTEQVIRLTSLTPAAGGRHNEANMARIDR